MAKSKITLKSLLCNVGAILMGALLIGAYFIPFLKLDSGLKDWSCSNVIADGAPYNHEVYTAIAVLGLIAMILGCMLILGSIVNLVIKVKNLDLCLVAISLLIAVLAVVMLVIVLANLGDYIILGFGAFAFLIAGVVASLCTMLNRKK